MARNPRHHEIHRPGRGRLILAALAVVGLVGLSLLSGGRDGQAQDEVGTHSFDYLGGQQPLATSTTVAQASTPDPNNPNATVVAPPTTAAPPSQCGGDHRPVFGCPLLVDTFDSNVLNTGPQGWSVYEYPDANFPRVAKNFEVKNGEMQLHGTYNRANGEILGAGVANHIGQRYGRWELRMRVEKGRGFSAASLLWPVDDNWPTDGEVDLFEIPSAQRQRISQTIHNGVRNNVGSNKIDMDATQWHTYAVEWTPSRLVYYVDNKATWTVTKSLLIPSSGDLNMTVQLDPGTKEQCGGWFECPDASTPDRTTMYVDYVKVWKYQPDVK